MTGAIQPPPAGSRGPETAEELTAEELTAEELSRLPADAQDLLGYLRIIAPTVNAFGDEAIRQAVFLSLIDAFAPDAASLQRSTR